MWVSGLLLAGSSSLAVGTDPPPRTELPDTPLGRRVSVFVAAFQKADWPGIVGFFEQNLSAQALSQRRAAEGADRIVRLRADLGQVTVRGADERPPASLVVIVEGERQRLSMLTFDFAPAPPHLLLGIKVDDADADDLAGPLRSMTESEALTAIEQAANEAAAADRHRLLRGGRRSPQLGGRLHPRGGGRARRHVVRGNLPPSRSRGPGDVAGGPVPPTQRGRPVAPRRRERARSRAT